MNPTNNPFLKRWVSLSLMLVMTALMSYGYDFVVDSLAYKKHADGTTVGVTRINNVGQSNYTNLIEANIPETVTYSGVTYTVTAIEDHAFSGWASNTPLPLTTVVIPNTVTSIGHDAFYECQNLKTVTFGDSVESIGSSAFFGCTSLESIELPVKLTKIESYTFGGCSSLKSVTFGKNVESIGYSVFSSCNNLKDIYSHLMNPVATTSIGAFAGFRRSLCTLHVPIGTKGLYESCEPWNSFINIIEDLEADYNSHAWIHMDASNMSIYPGRTHQLTAFINPYDMDLSWSSSDESVATVDENGVVKGIATGDAVITVTSNGYGHVTATCQVTVKNGGNTNDDINGDGQVDISDVNLAINMMLGKGNANPDASPEGDRNCDVTGDGRIDISDVNQLITTMLGKPKPLLRYMINDVMLNMVHVDGGTFTMGATPEQGTFLPLENEKPTHQVTLKSYYIGQTEVTYELWMTVMGNYPPNYRFHYEQAAISYVSWDMCQEFIVKLNELTGLNFRLPTEAEWEFAARGGNKSEGYIYSGSNNVNEVAWYNIGNPDQVSPMEPQPVATKKANELTAYDMSGNVSEWCQDWYGDYSSDEQTDPTGPDSGEYRVLRGGSYYEPYRYCRIPCRRRALPTSYDSGSGLRLAM